VLSDQGGQSLEVVVIDALASVADIVDSPIQYRVLKRAMALTTSPSAPSWSSWPVRYA